MKCIKMIFALAVVAGTVVCGQSLLEAQQPQADGKLSQRDQLRIKAQQICPVSGQKLGNHGQPIKVKVGKESVYLCCKGLLKKQGRPSALVDHSWQFCKSTAHVPGDEKRAATETEMDHCRRADCLCLLPSLYQKDRCRSGDLSEQGRRSVCRDITKVIETITTDLRIH